MAVILTGRGFGPGYVPFKAKLMSTPDGLIIVRERTLSHARLLVAVGIAVGVSVLGAIVGYVTFVSGPNVALTTAVLLPLLVVPLAMILKGWRETTIGTEIRVSCSAGTVEVTRAGATVSRFPISQLNLVLHMNCQVLMREWFLTLSGPGVLLPFAGFIRRRSAEKYVQSLPEPLRRCFFGEGAILRGVRGKL